MPSYCMTTKRMRPDATSQIPATRRHAEIPEEFHGGLSIDDGAAV